MQKLLNLFDFCLICLIGICVFFMSGKMNRNEDIGNKITKACNSKLQLSDIEWVCVQTWWSSKATCIFILRKM